MGDGEAIKAAKRLNGRVKNVEFIMVKPNEELPFVGEKKVIILDVIEGIKKITVFKGKAVDKLILSPRVSCHDYDLAFQLKYLQKLGKLGKVTIIGLPNQSLKN